MKKKPATVEEKIQCLKDYAPHVKVGKGVAIYGQYSLHENYYLCSNGEVKTRRRGGGPVIYTMSIEQFAERFGEKGLNYAVRLVKGRVIIPKNSV